MGETLILLTPVLVLLIIVVFGFTGCGEPFTSEETEEEPPPTEPPEEPPGPKYAELVESTPGFVALWPMNESAGKTIAPALGPPNIDGVYMPGATPGSPGALVNKDPYNFAPSLDGTTGYVEVPFSPLLNVQGGMGGLPFSVEVWVKPAEAIPPGTEQMVISSHHTSDVGNQRGYEIALIGTGANATVRGRVFWTDPPFVTNVDITPAQGDPLAWHHIVLTHSGSGAAGNVLGLYVSVAGVAGTTHDTESNAEYREVQAGGAGERPLRFGAGHLPTGEPEKFFKGFIDEVAYYDGVLGLTDVEQHFQAF